MATVREFMSRPPLTIDSEASVADACKIMGDRHAGSILTSRKGVVSGIFTERDLFSKVLGKNREFASVKVGDCASSPLITIGPTTDIKEAARIMSEMKVRRLVVVQDGKPVGVFTAADLARAVGEFPLDI